MHNDNDRSTTINDEHYNHLIDSRDKYERAYNVNLDNGASDDPEHVDVHHLTTGDIDNLRRLNNVDNQHNVNDDNPPAVQ